MTTIEIARLAGVSQATVSRVINRHPGVSDDNVHAVRTAMKRVQYTPRPRKWQFQQPTNLAAKNIAVLLLDESYANHSTLAVLKLQGVGRALREAGCNMIFGLVGSADDLPPLVAAGKVEGVLLWGQQAPRGLLSKLGKLPSVWLSSHAGEGSQSTLMGNEAVGRIAAEYLIERGCQRLALLNVSHELPSHRARGEGFQFAAHQAGLPVEVIAGDESSPPQPPRWNPRELEPRVAELVDRLLVAAPRADGVFVPNDQLTAIVHRMLKARGVDLRNDLRMVSTGNDEPYLLGLDPRPATIDLGPELTGRCAVQQLLWKIKNPNETSRVQVTVEPKLVLGEE
jgi:LacI family transcriptional regulator